MHEVRGARAGTEGHADPRETLIEVRDLRMRYGDNDVLTGVDLAVHRGEVVTLLGPNGAGKTTTIEILEGFRNRSASEVTCSARIRPTPTRTGEPGSASCCSPGATTLAGRRASCSATSAPTTSRTARRNGPGRTASTS